ncbi:MAG: hypothetical protein NTW06_01250, partial [Candidatus Falkowbacteria bacterium]|nr:hypothetical protein [Candidatus Falkowbacteria bacterium]
MKKENKIKSPEGIKGWLFIITSIFIIGVLFIFKKVFYYLSFIKEFYSGEILLNNYENIIAIFYSILYIISIFLVIFTLILEFTKSRRFPKMAIITVWFC